MSHRSSSRVAEMSTCGGSSPVFDRITQQVLEDLAQLADVAIYTREIVGCDLSVTLVDPHLEIFTNVIEDIVEVDRFERITTRFDARVLEQSVDHVVHPLGAVDGEFEELFTVFVERIAVPILD